MEEQHTRPRRPVPPGRRAEHRLPLRLWEARRDARAVPWPSTLALAFFVLVGTRFAAEGQPDREDLDVFAGCFWSLAPALLLLRNRWPVVVPSSARATTLVYFGAGYPYGPIFLTVAVACFARDRRGHRRAAWGAVGRLWAGHLLVAHWLYRWLPPQGDRRPAPWGQETRHRRLGGGDPRGLGTRSRAPRAVGPGAGGAGGRREAPRRRGAAAHRP